MKGLSANTVQRNGRIKHANRKFKIAVNPKYFFTRLLIECAASLRHTGAFEFTATVKRHYAAICSIEIQSSEERDPTEVYWQTIVGAAEFTIMKPLYFAYP
jgi:hypothetical protein